MILKRFFACILACYLLLLPMAAMSSCAGGGDSNASSEDGTGAEDTTSDAENSEADRMSVETIKENPIGTILRAMQNAGAQFFADDAGLFGTVQNTMEKGSVAISFAHETLMGDIKRINETLYVDAEAKQYVSQTQVLMNRRLLSAYLFFDREGLTLKGNSLLGSDKAVQIKLSELFTSFGDSAAAELSGLSGDVLDMIVSGFGIASELYGMLFADDPTAAEEMLRELSEILSEEIKEVGEGFLLSYFIDDEALTALADRMGAWLEELGGEDALAERIDAILTSCRVSVRIEMMIDKNDASMKSILLQGHMTPSSGKNAEIYMAWREYENQMKLTASVTLGTRSVSTDMTLQKQNEGAVTSYTLSLDSAQDGNEHHLLDAKYVYDIGGGVRVTGTLYDEKGDPIDLVLLGQITVSETDASICFTSLQYKSLIAKFDASITFTPSVPLPDAPENPMDIVEMTEEDWQTLVEEFKGSVFGKMFFGEKETK